ncbi:hypothetical protein ABIE18_002601 [Arthrobacter sp. 2762]
MKEWVTIPRPLLVLRGARYPLPKAPLYVAAAHGTLGRLRPCRAI